MVPRARRTGSGGFGGSRRAGGATCRLTTHTRVSLRTAGRDTLTGVSDTPVPPALPPPDAVAGLVARAREGSPEALDALVPLVYGELRRLAAAYLRRERHGLTLQPTALVHDVYLRLFESTPVAWEGRAHLIGVAARSMRQVIVDRARARRAAKRGGDRIRVTLEPGLLSEVPAGIDLEALDEALARLGRLDDDLARVVEMRFFGGLSVEESAVALGVSPATVKRRWTTARAWLIDALGDHA